MTEFLSRWPWRGPISTPQPSKFADKVGSLHEMERIASEVAERYGLKLGDLKGRSNVRRITWPRQEAMAAIYATDRFSSITIGQFFGGRDHTTVLHAVTANTQRAEAA